MDYGQPVVRAPPGKKVKGINCVEFRGIGPPSSLTGGDGIKLGDIYLDMSGDLPGGVYKVYAKLLDGWAEWLGDTGTEKTSAQLWHPCPSKPETVKPQHEVFYFAFGPHIKPAWVSLQVYRAAVKKNHAKVNELLERSLDAPASRAYPRSAHVCVSALLNKERGGQRTTAKRKLTDEDAAPSGKRMHVDEANDGMKTPDAFAGSDYRMTPGVGSPFYPLIYTPPDTPHSGTGVSSNPYFTSRPDGLPEHSGMCVAIVESQRPETDIAEAIGSYSLEKGTQTAEASQPVRLEQGAQTECGAWSAPALRPPSSPVSSLSTLTDDEEMDSSVDADIYVASYVGKCWPKDAKLLTWSNGKRTIGPWQTPPGERNFVRAAPYFLFLHDSLC